MGKVKQFSKSDKSRIVYLVKSGTSQTDVVIPFEVSQSVISKTVKRDADNEPLSPGKRSGRPRVTSERTDRRMVHLVEQVSNITSVQIKESFPGVLDNVDPSTIRTLLTRQYKMKARKSLWKPLATVLHFQWRSAKSTSAGPRNSGTR